MWFHWQIFLSRELKKGFLSVNKNWKVIGREKIKKPSSYYENHIPFIEKYNLYVS